MSNTPMTPTPEGKQLAADLANAEEPSRSNPYPIWEAKDFDGQVDLNLALARLATEHLALKAKHEEALADLREIELIARRQVRGNSGMADIATIAAKYRVETDPLLIEARELVARTQHNWPDSPWHVNEAAEIRAGNRDRTLVVMAAIEGVKRGYEIGGKS